MMDSSSQELKGNNSENIPIPSPRNRSAIRMSILDQNDSQKSSDKPDSQPAASTLEGRKQDQTLLQELDYLRQVNKKLQETLMRRERDLDTMKIDAELLEQATQARIAEKTAGRRSNAFSFLDLLFGSLNKPV